MFDKEKPLRPPCLTRRGCEYEDVAPDEELTRRVDAFLQVEMLSFSGTYGKLADKLVDESGLCDESADTILQAKVTLKNYQDYESKKAEQKRKAKELALKGR